MVITEDELKKLIEPNADLVEISTISSDGRTFLTRIPKEVAEDLNITKGDKFKWLVKDKTKEIKLELFKHEK